MEEIKKTCLHDRHVAMGALMSPFAGFDMPIEYAGIVDEHNAVRNDCGVFDVSHMGEVLIKGPDAERYTNYIFTNDIKGADNGKVFYGMMCKSDGGVVDDLLVYKRSDNEFFLVINAANIDKDVAWIKGNTEGFDVEVTDLSGHYAQLAVQGPNAEKVMKDVLDVDCSDLTFYTFKDITLDGEEGIVSRTGYTGEDGFEIYATPGIITRYWDKLIDSGVCAPCGLGCRDTLRFEAGLPLYGDELAEDITPLEAGLSMFAKLDKDEMIGLDALRSQKADGVRRRIVGLELDGTAIPRHGYEVLNQAGEKVGEVTTGYRSITLGKSIAFAMVDIDYVKLGTPLQVKIRRKVFPATVIKKRFYTPNYKK